MLVVLIRVCVELMMENCWKVQVLVLHRLCDMIVLCLDLHQDCLETVIPKEKGASVMVVTGKHKHKVNNYSVTSVLVV